MKNSLVLATGLVLLVSHAFAVSGEATPSAGYLNAGVGIVDITPTDSVVLAGSPTRLKSS